MDIYHLKLIVAFAAIIIMIIGILSSILSDHIKALLTKIGIKLSTLFFIFIVLILIFIVLTFIPVFDTKNTTNENVNSNQTNNNQSSNNESNNSGNSNISSNNAANISATPTFPLTEPTSKSQVANVTTSSNQREENEVVKVTPLPTIATPTPTPTVVSTQTPTSSPTPKPMPTPNPLEYLVGRTCWSKGVYNAKRQPYHSSGITGHKIYQPNSGGATVQVVKAVYDPVDKNLIWLQVKDNGDVVGWYKLYYFAKCEKVDSDN